jgi:thioredoxin 1
MATELTKSTFEDFTKEGVVLLDFHADWCMPCVMMGPIVNDVGEKMKGKAKFGKVNVEDNKELAQKFEVSSIPKFVILKDGKVVEEFLGAMSEDELENKVENYL